VPGRADTTAMGQLFSGRFLSGHIRPDRSPLDVNGMVPPATDASPQGHQAGQLRLRSGIGRHHCNLRCYVYRAVDQYGQVIDILVSVRRDADAARRFFRTAIDTLKVTPTEVVTDKSPVYPRVLDEVVPAAWHHVEQYTNNRIEADHSRLKHRLRPMRGLWTDRTVTVIITGIGFMQNLRRGNYELGVHLPRHLRVASAFTELMHAI
jgi:IS1 family transposase